MPQETLAAATTAPSAARDAVAEANHRIANNLAMIAGLVRVHARAISSAPEPLGNDAVRVLLEEIGGRIDSIAHLHALLARGEHGEPIDLASYLQEISATVVASLTFMGKAELIHRSAEMCLLPPERALTLGLIIGELVTNAVKYAHPAGVTGKIMVGCRRVDGTVIVEVVDDGVGLPDGFDPMQSGGLGMRLVRSLATQLKAKLLFEDTGTGLSVQLHLRQDAPVSADE